jgi:GNAT superfamily N-acetyltransferase
VYELYREFNESDFNELLRLRYLLHFDCEKQETYNEFIENLQGNSYYDLWKMFVYERDNGMLGGFIEIGFINAEKYTERLTNFIDTDYHEELQQRILLKNPIPVVESWYVDEDLRGKHIGMTLMQKAEQWVKDNDCPFILSDTDDFRDV